MEIGTPIVKEIYGKLGLCLLTELKDGCECIDFFTIEQIERLVKNLKNK